MDQSKDTVAWLTVSPSVHNGMELFILDLEFIDLARLHVGKLPNGLPNTCDGPVALLSRPNMPCSARKLARLPSDTIISEIRIIVFVPRYTKSSAVIDKPLIHPCHDSAGNVLPNTTDGGPLPKTCGDLGIHGFWKHGELTIVDIWVIDLNSSCQRGHSAMKCLWAHGKSKKDKYGPACIANRRSFTPRAYSVDGLRGLRKPKHSLSYLCLPCLLGKPYAPWHPAASCQLPATSRDNAAGLTLYRT
jgi:hypothetical protein